MIRDRQTLDERPAAGGSRRGGARLALEGIFAKIAEEEKRTCYANLRVCVSEVPGDL